MNTQILAVIIAEGSKIVGQWYRNRPIQIAARPPSAVKMELPEPTLIAQSVTVPSNPEKATEIATGCIPCAVGHLGTCSGLLNEAMRFAREDGIDSNDVVDRVGYCLDELNTMERVDLRPEMIVNLPEDEKALANRVLAASRNTRHALETAISTDSLERVAADTQILRTEVWREHMKARTTIALPQVLKENLGVEYEELSPKDQEALKQRIIEKIDELEIEEE